MRRAAEQKVAVAAYLGERFDPELLWVVFMAADHIHHLAWPEWDERGPESRVAEVYRSSTRRPARSSSVAGGERRHGRLRPRRRQPSGVVNLNAWLASEGLLTYTGGADQRRRGAPADRAAAQAAGGLRNAVKQRMPGLRERSYALRRGRGVVDWSRTRASRTARSATS